MRSFGCWQPVLFGRGRALAVSLTPTLSRREREKEDAPTFLRLLLVPGAAVALD